MQHRRPGRLDDRGQRAAPWARSGSARPGIPAAPSRAIVATFKRSSFLDYVYFTQLETSDPVTYGYTSANALAGANSQCSKTEIAGSLQRADPGHRRRLLRPDRLRQRREDQRSPAHERHHARPAESPTFGRTAADVIEVRAADDVRSAGRDSCGSSDPELPRYAESRRAPVLTPPATNGSLATRRPGSVKYSRHDRHQRSMATTMTVTNNGVTKIVDPDPASGVIYVAIRRCLHASYSPFASGLDDLSEHNDLRVRQRLRQRHLLGPADDRGRERHHHRRRPLSRQTQQSERQRPARPDRQQLRPRQPPVLDPDLEGQLRRRQQRRTTYEDQPDRRRDPRDRPLVHRRPLQLRSHARNDDGERRDLAEVPRPGRDRRQHARPATSRTTPMTIACGTSRRPSSSIRSSRRGRCSARPSTD